jgi:hypothetical protein
MIEFITRVLFLYRCERKSVRITKRYVLLKSWKGRSIRFSSDIGCESELKPQFVIVTLSGVGKPPETLSGRSVVMKALSGKM